MTGFSVPCPRCGTYGCVVAHQGLDGVAEPGTLKEVPASVLTPETARALLRECVTIVGPGEVLAVRLPMDVTVGDLDRARQYASAIEREAGVKVAFIPGEDFAVAQAGPDNSPDNLTTEGSQ